MIILFYHEFNFKIFHFILNLLAKLNKKLIIKSDCVSQKRLGYDLKGVSTYFLFFLYFFMPIDSVIIE